jgi:aminoglycoside phosphotransferase (APT) family kinase protein
LILRLPRQTPWLGDPSTQLSVEAAAFRRAEPSGVTPRLTAVIEPSPVLPLGGLLVEDVAGHPPRLPADLAAIASALERLHGLSLPTKAERPPLPDHATVGPIAATLAFIERQRPYLAAGRFTPETIAALDQEYAWACRYAAETRAEDQPIALVGTDTHPGNFIVRPDGSAVLVDLERVCYGSPAIDLAHATLRTSTFWDLEVQTELGPGDTQMFYRNYLNAVGPARAEVLASWLLPARRITWLRTMMWAVRLSTLIDEAALQLEGQLAAHTRYWLDRFLQPFEIAQISAEWRDGKGIGRGISS